MQINFLHLHSPLFFGAKNYGLKLDEKSAPGVEMTYHREYGEVWLRKPNNKGGYYEGIIPRENVACMEPTLPLVETPTAKLPSGELTVAYTPTSEVETKAAEVIQEAEDRAKKSRQRTTVKPTAQASTPTDHVFAGPGAGKTHD